MLGKKRKAKEIEATTTTRESRKIKIAACSNNDRRREAKKGTIPIIPEEIMFNILLCLPADVLYNVMRYVCRNWYDIIRSPTFIYAHLRHQKLSAAGFLFQRFNFSSPLVHVHLGEMSSDVELRQLAFPFRGFAMATCNGLVWLVDYPGRQHSWLVNPVTKQHLALPPFDHFLDMKCCYLRTRNCSLGYAASSGVYKVVYYPPKSVACAIHTVGVDNNSWRPVSINICERGFTSSSTPYFYEPSSLGGFIYWRGNNLPFIISLNVETEIFKQISIQQLLPQTAFGHIPCFKLFAMGSSLSLVMMSEEYLWQVWLLTDPEENGEWERLCDINLQGQSQILLNLYGPDVQHICPIGWLRSRELLVFNIPCSPTNIIYNVKTGGIHSSFEEGSNGKYYVRLDSVVMSAVLFP